MALVAPSPLEEELHDIDHPISASDKHVTCTLQNGQCPAFSKSVLYVHLVGLLMRNSRAQHPFTRVQERH